MFARREISDCDNPASRRRLRFCHVVLMARSYSISNTKSNSLSNYLIMHSRAMKGRELLKLLLDKRGLTANALSKALKGATKQPQIQKFLSGTATEPRRSTLSPVAAFFDVPIDAFYDEFLADKVAYQLGLVEATDIDANALLASGTVARESAAPIPFPPAPIPSNLREALRLLRTALAHEPPGVRRSVVAIMSDLADRAEDDHFSDQMIERIMGALGRQGNGTPPQSTPSPQTLIGGAK